MRGRPSAFIPVDVLALRAGEPVPVLSFAHRPVEVVASGGGAVLGASAALLGRIRPAAKPLHPAGSMYRGVLHRNGNGRGDSKAEAWGVAWLDEPGQDPVLVRVSRAVGLPSGVPDIFGLALQVQHARGPADLLFATTGTGPLTRSVLLPRLAAEGAFTTLLPYRSPRGPLVLRADWTQQSPQTHSAEDSASVRLSVAAGTGNWVPFAHAALRGPGLDEPVCFDPVLDTIPGLAPYGWVRRLREPAYAAARRSRRHEPDPTKFPSGLQGTRP